MGDHGEIPRDQILFELFGTPFTTPDMILVAALGFIAYWYFILREEEPSPNANKIFKFEAEAVYKTPPVSEGSGFISKMKADSRNIIIFYGSQTGNAKEFAGRLAREAQRYGMKALVANPEFTNMDDLVHLKELGSHHLALFVTASYGEGEPTDNAQKMYKWLAQGKFRLEGLQYAVFGLGNSLFETFNAMGKFVDRRLAELGATRLFPLGLGDNGNGHIDDDFVAWKESFWAGICEKFGIDPSVNDVSIRQYGLVTHEGGSIPPEKIFIGQITNLHSFRLQQSPFDLRNPFLSRMISKRELHSGGGGRSCMHIEFDITNSNIMYEVGDHMGIYAKNDPELVERLGELLGVDLDDLISLVNLDEDSPKKHPFPCPCTSRTALSCYIDITSPPRSYILKELADYASAEAEKELLKLLGGNSAEGKAKYKEWVVADCRSIVHVLEDLPSVKPPLDLLLEFLPRLQMRYFSISSSPLVYPNSIHITAALTKYATPTGRINNGVATTFMAGIEPRPLVKGGAGGGGEKSFLSSQLIPIFTRPSQFQLPVKLETPIIMIGPGTGIAPFRGFLQEREFFSSEGKPVGANYLYFGCRNQADDFLYRAELEGYVRKGLLTLHVAFSRDQVEKVYVQHLLKQQASQIWKLIGKDNAHVYVCGEARHMAKDVHDTIINIIAEKGGLGVGEAVAYVKEMEAEKRYSTDVWS